MRAKPIQWVRTLDAKLDVDIRDAWLVAALIAVSFGVRALFVNPGFFHHDSILMIRAVEQSLDEGGLAPLLDGRYAYVAFSIPFALVFRALDWPMDLAFNLLTAGVASLSVILQFLLVRDITRSRFAGASAALLLSFMPVYWSVTTHALVHAFSVTLVLFAFTGLLRSNASGSRAVAAAAATALVLAISARVPNLLLLPAFACLWLDPRVRGGRLRFDRERLARQAPFVVAPVLIGLAAMGWAQGDLILAKARYDAFLGPLSPVFVRALRGLDANLSIVAWILVAAGAGLSIVGERRAVVAALFLWGVPVLFFYGNVASFAPRFYCILFPVLALFMALALQRIRRCSRLAALALLAWVVFDMAAVAHPIVRDRHHFSGGKEYALWLDGRIEPEALVIAMDYGVFVEYYAGRRVASHPQGPAGAVLAWAAGVLEEIDAGTPVYMMESGFSYDPDEIVRRTVMSHFEMTPVGSHLTEDYHKASLQRRVHRNRLFRLTRKAS
jgi:4-amino-4-deoxy-L-arabinose transferase-like glycosyltransferase